MTATQIYEVIIWTIFMLMLIFVTFSLMFMVWHDIQQERKDDRDKKRTTKHGKQFRQNAKDRKHRQSMAQDRE